MQAGGLFAFAEQDTQSGASTPRRSRVSSIFQQKSVKPDDIDAEFLKHAHFAAQRGSATHLMSTSSSSAADIKAAVTSSEQTASSADAPAGSSKLADMQPVALEDFTLAKIEQSIADIEAELGWTSEGLPPTQAAPATAASVDKVVTAAPASILSSAPASRPSAGPQASPAGASQPAPFQPQVKRLSFMGELTGSQQNRSPLETPGLAAFVSAAAKPEPRSSLTATTATNPLADTNDSTAEDNGHATEQPAPASAADASAKHVPGLPLGDTRQLDHSLSEANLGALSSRSLDGQKRQLTSMYSMQSDAARGSSKKQPIRHSVSGKITPSAGSGTSVGYSSRYATRQLSGRASPVLSEPGLSSGKRSLLTSPTASVHGGQGIPAQVAGRLSGGRPATAVAVDDRPGATLAGAAAVLSVKMQARPNSAEGLGWHLATGDGLPFSPRGSLVASSGGSRTLRPITSQQEALFDAEGNMLPRCELPSQQAEGLQLEAKVNDAAAPPSQSSHKPAAAPADAAKLKAKAQSKLRGKQGAHDQSAPREDLIGAKAEQGGQSMKQKTRPGMLSLVMFPCFCMRPRTTSAEDPYHQGSLRQRFAAKDAALPTQMGPVSSKGLPAPKSALKQKQPNSSLVKEPSTAGWDLGTHVHEADAAVADSSEVELTELPEEQAWEQIGRGLQGAISLAPRPGGLTDASQAHADLQEATILEDVVSPAASFRSQRSIRSMVPGTEVAPQNVATSGTKSQADSLSHSRSESHEEEETEGAASTAGVAAAAEESNLSDEAGRGASKEAAAEQTFGWDVATRESELDGLGMTGRSASSKSTTRRRKVWEEGPEVASPGEVSHALEDMMLQRFPELQPLLLQTSFSNKSAPWRPIKSGHTSHAPSRGTSLGVSREASFAHSRPESRTGHLPMSHLGVSPLEALSGEPPALGSESNSHLELKLGSGSMPQQSLQQGNGLMPGLEEDEGETLPLVEAAALGASAPGAVVRVPTSTGLSQADQIALRYQHQVQFQLQQSLGGVAVAPTLGRPSSKSPTRRSPTKHRPFQLSSSNWRSLPADSAPMGKSQAVPSAERQPASPKKARSPSKSPIRTASSPQKQPAGARKKAASSSAKGTSHVERQAERQNRGIEGQGDGASQSTHDADVMGFGTYGGVAFSSFVPARPASSLDAAQGLDLQEDDEDWADDSGKWGELTRKQPAAVSKPGTGQTGWHMSSSQPLAAQDSMKQSHSAATQRQGGPKQSSISLADITADAAEEEGFQAADELPDQAVGASNIGEAGVAEGLGGAGRVDSQSYLSMLERLAHEGEAGSVGGSESELSPAAAQVPKQDQPWRETQFQSGNEGFQSAAHVHQPDAAATEPVSAEESHLLSDISDLNFGDEPVESLLPDEASDVHMHSATTSVQLQQPALSNYHWIPASTQAAVDSEHTGVTETLEQPSALALALAALAATAAQKQAQQLSAAGTTAAEANPAADAEDAVSMSSISSGDVLADAAAAAAAAGLSRHRAAPAPQQPEVSAPVQESKQAGPKLVPSAAAAESRPAEIGPAPQQAQHEVQTQQAQQEGTRQRASSSGDWAGPASSGPSWSGAAGDGRVQRFQANQAVNYVGKSARRPKVAAPPSKGRLQGLFSKLRRGGSKEEEECDLSRPASVAGPRPLDSEAEPSLMTKSGSWLPKALSRPGSDSAAQTGSPSTPQGRTRFADDPPLASQAAQPDLQEGTNGPLPSRKAPPETFVALPSLPVPGPIAADPVLPASRVSSWSKFGEGSAAAPVSHGASKGVSSSGLVVVPREMSQDKRLPQPSSGSGSEDSISEMSVE